MGERILGILSDQCNLYVQNGVTVLNEEMTNIFTRALQKHGDWYERETVESNVNVKQIIAYTIVRNKDTGELFTYKRSSKDEEARLHAKWSIGVGGHVNSNDMDMTADSTPMLELIGRCAIRELNEEIQSTRAPSLVPTATFEGSWLCLVQDDVTDVGKVHLGVVGLISLPKEYCDFMQMEHHDWAWQTLESLKQNESLETWSHILVKHLSSDFMQMWFAQLDKEMPEV